MDKIGYDEFGYFAENAEEHGILYEGPPEVRRESVNLEDGRVMSGLVWGSEPAELVFLHGGAQNAHTWDSVCLALGIPAVAIDMPGHGHSGPPAGGQGLDLARNARDVAATIKGLAPSATTIVGMSLGGLTALKMSETEPDMFSSMLLVDITPGVNSEKAEYIHKFVNGPKSFSNFEELLARTMEFNPTRSESSLRRGILHNARQHEDGSWEWRHARHRVFKDSSGTEEVVSGAAHYEELWPVLEGFSGSMVLARGMREQSVVDNADEEEFKRRRPHGRVEHFESAGHSVQGDMPIELAELIADELNRP